MNLTDLSTQVNRLLQNIWAIIAFFKEYLVDPAKDVSITFRNADNTESVTTFPNIAKQIEDGLANGILEKVLPVWAVDVTTICLGSDNLVYYPNVDGDPANNDPVGKIDSTDWFGGFATVAEAIMQMESLYIKEVYDDKAPALGGELNCSGNTINGASVRQIADVAPATGTTHTFDFANGDMQKVTCPAGGSLTLAFSNFPAGVVAGFFVDFINAGDCTIIHPDGMIFTRGESPEYTVSGKDRIKVVGDKDGVLSHTFDSKNMSIVAV